MCLIFSQVLILAALPYGEMVGTTSCRQRFSLRAALATEALLVSSLDEFLLQCVQHHCGVAASQAGQWAAHASLFLRPLSALTGD